MINSLTKVCAKVVANFYVEVRHKKRPKGRKQRREVIRRLSSWGVTQSADFDSQREKTHREREKKRESKALRSVF